MTPQEIGEGLERIAASSNFVHDAHQLVDAWDAASVGFAAIEPILRFMERHPEVDFGAPGPLVHFMEQFHRDGYEDLLFASLERKPIGHTVWMLNRIINGTRAPQRRERLLERLQAVMRHPDADEYTRNRARRVLDHQDR